MVIYYDSSRNTTATNWTTTVVYKQRLLDESVITKIQSSTKHLGIFEMAIIMVTYEEIRQC